MSFTKFFNSQFYKRQSKNLIKLGFDFNSPPEHEYLKIQSLLYTEYHIKCESMLSMMKTFNIPSSRTMDIIFDLFDIESRSFSESNRTALEQGRSTLPSSTFTHIWHKSWFGETFYLRSTHEEEFALSLDADKIMYQVESMRLKYFCMKENKYKIAIPDFYLPESNTIVEVKSTYWLDKDQMIDKKHSYISLGYKFALYLDHKLIEDW